MKTKNGLHQAWVVMIGCCFLLMSLALITTCMSFFVLPVSEALGFERGAFTIYYSLAALVGVFAMPVWGRIIPKLGIKASVAIAGAGGAACMALFSVCTSLVAFYILGILLGIMIAGMTMLPASILINAWFESKRGLAMGIVMACSGVGGAIFSPILAWVIENYSWQTGYLVNAAAMAVLTVPTALFLLKGKPSELGLLPYGASDSPAGIAQTAKDATGVSAKIATKSAAFIMLAVAVVLINVMASLLQHIPAHLVQVGIDATAAAGIISIYMIVVIIAKVLLGIANDRFGTVAVLITAFVLWGGSFVVLALTQGYLIAVIGAALFGMGVSVVTVMPPLITGQMFGQKDYSAIYAVIGALSSLGLAIGTPIIGLVYDKTGSYAGAFFGCLVVLVASIVLLLAAMKSAKKLPVT
jgi:MFS family permease